jgi:ABC-type branched-subunit amino acid transport system ATPase component
VAIDRWSPTRRARSGLGRSFQSLELIEDLTVRENLLVACDAHDLGRYATDLVHPGRPALTPVAATAVREFGLEPDLDTLPDALPHGRRRLVAIARAVAASPKVLLLDEPAAGLSGPEGDELGHLRLVMATCDRVAVLDFGRLIALGTPAEVTADEAVVAAYLGTPA